MRLERIWFPSLLDPLKVPYEGFIDGKSVGIVYCNPISKKLRPESRIYLESLGYTNIEIEK